MSASTLQLVGPSATAARETPAETPIQPGAPVCPVGDLFETVTGTTCGEWSTLNFVFRDAKHRLYIGAAGHNFAGVGDGATARGEQAPFGTVVYDADSVDFLHPGDPIEPDGSDFALIRVNRSRYKDVEPSVRGFGGPTGLADATRTATGDTINAFGQGRNLSGVPAEARSGPLLHDSARVFSSGVPEYGGDSGMPYLHAATGKALGVNAICICGVGPGVYPTVREILDRLSDAGFELSLVTAALL